MVSRKLAVATRCGITALSLSLCCVSGPAAGSESVARQHEIAAEHFVAQRLQIWQERLNLRDRGIRIQMARTERLEAKTLGNIKWDTDLKVATISVLSSYDYRLPYREMLSDMEFTVVHELVHLQLASLPRSEASRRVEEHAVNELATALLKLAKH
jgi:hypothetical protein